MEAVIIRVTQDHIKRGTKKDCRSCPIAMAVKEQFAPKGYYVSVSCSEITIGEHTKYPSPQEVVRFINAFDCYETGQAQPFEFSLGYV